MPTVSIILPVYNAIIDLPRALYSLINQTYSDFEVIAVDDGSTDGSGEMLDRFSQKDPRIRVIHQQNAGSLGKTLNKALEFAQGKYIARQDADDASHPSRLENQVRYMDSHPIVGLCGTWNWHIDSQIGPIFSSEIPDNHYLLLSFLKKKINPFIHGSVIFHKDLINKVGGYRGSLVEDFDLWLRISDVCNLGMCQKLGYFYWHSTGGISSGAHLRQKSLVQLSLKLRGERSKYGRELTSWDDNYHEIITRQVSESNQTERITSNHYSRSIHLLRLKRWDQARAELVLASNGEGQYVQKAKRNLILFKIAPVARFIYQILERQELQRYAKNLPAGTNLPEYLIHQSGSTAIEK